MRPTSDTPGVLRRAVHAGLRLVPGKAWLVRRGAALPCRLKGAWSTRLLYALLVRVDPGRIDRLDTNLGIHDDLVITLPRHVAGAGHLFGTPEQYEGERGALRLVRALLRHCSAFVDVGAHVGYYTFFARTHASAVPIYWFEPDPELQALIASNVARNDLKGIHGSGQAIGAATGPAPFFRARVERLMSSLTDTYAARIATDAMTVSVVTFDEFARIHALPAPMLVKVDVENAEWGFVEGAVRSLDSVAYLILEILGPARERGLVDHLTDRFGLRAYYINDCRLELVSRDDGRDQEGEFNWLFCRDTPEALRSRLQGHGLEVVS